MVKFRRLSIEELRELEQEFINFLVVNGIEAKDWEKMKQQDLQRAEDMLDIFSDFVFEKIFLKVRFLNLKSAKKIYSYQCLEDKFVCVSAEISAQSMLDLGNLDLQNYPIDQKIFKIETNEKSYNLPRALELFILTQSGAEISDGTIFKKLCLAL